MVHGCFGYPEKNGTNRKVITMNFSTLDLLTIRNLCLSNYNDERLSDFDYTLLNIADKIERKLGDE